MISMAEIDFCFIDIHNRTEIISFKSYHSLNEIFESFENSSELRDKLNQSLNNTEPFYITLKEKDTQQYIKCNGKSITNKKNIIIGSLLILEDISESVIINTKAQVQKKSILESKQYYIDILNTLPYLVWEYNNTELQYANKAYRDLFDNHNMITGSDSLYKRVNVNGRSKILAINSINSSRSIINFAHDITEIHNLKEEKKMLYNTQKSMISNLNTPIAFYDKHQCLKLYNNAFANLWQFEKRWLNQAPHYDEICKKLLDEGKILEDSIAHGSHIFTEIIEPYRGIISLKDGKYIHVKIIPSFEHSLWFIYEYIIK